MFAPKLTGKITKDLHIEGHDAIVVIKYVKPGVVQKILQSTLNVIAKQGKGQEDMVTEIGFRLYDRNVLLVKECAIGWTGFKDEDGKEMKFNATNLEKMIQESDEFVDFVAAGHEKFSEEVQAEMEEAEKN